MASLTRSVNLSRVIGTLCNRFSMMNVHVDNTQLSRNLRLLQVPLSSSFHTSSPKRDLMEFFDSKDNWGENEVKCGRAWNGRTSYKIKYRPTPTVVCSVEEKNMLLTMEHECNDQMKLFPSPERLDKVKISMENLEAVVRERNKAYHLLETGETGERPGRLVANPLGIKYYYKAKEHVLPPHMNVKWIRKQPIGFEGRAVRKFLLLYREKLYNEKRKGKNRSRNHVMMLLRRNPNLSVDLLQKKYPDVDIEKLRQSDKIRGHFVPKIDV
ncbi:LOW QUALITY PROTEIN: 39S ribosomal protein L47, mitochondrial [Eupeodes corollae]|uniref:LOW QUALITY PROTEIN: 39S ribosomal protein L47, mitochondrial n=1 Tax=Eupeodes corollae TaxID=290404 RepID=UPI002493BF4C|nr:LOW QUALITY PROTEIN: 39S ribosomal protein L47, mitochondrial [Eupeodes corollae]